MVNLGKRSKGCRECRKRKVKCDETLPTCNRCAKVGKTCEYPNALDLDFKDQTSSTRQKAVVRWRSRSKQHLDAVATEHASSPPCEPCHNTVMLLPQNILSASLDLAPATFAIKRFFSDFASPPNEPIPWLGFLETVPARFTDAPVESHLSNAVSAVAFANLLGRYNHASIKSAAVAHYGLALKALRNALLDVNQIKSDDIICTIPLLALYESMVGDARSRTEVVQKHLEGGRQLSWVRRDTGIPLDGAQAVFSHIYLGGCLQKLCNYSRPPMPSKLWENNPRLQIPGASLLKLLHRTQELRSDTFEVASNVRSGSIPSRLQLKALLQEMEDVLRKFAALEAALPQDFQPGETNIKFLDQSDPRTKLMVNQDCFNSILHHENISAAICHMHLVCSKIIIHQSLRDGYDALEQANSNSHSKLAEKALLTDMCRSVWQFLIRETEGQRGLFCVEASGGIRGRFLFRPLKVAAFSAQATPSLISNSQIKFLNNVVSYLNQEQGIPQAREFLIEME